MCVCVCVCVGAHARACVCVCVCVWDGGDEEARRVRTHFWGDVQANLGGKLTGETEAIVRQ